MGKVYLVGIPDEDRYKIGWTRGAIDKRIAPLQTGNPKKIEVIHLFETEHYLNVETWMHNQFATKRMEGEWFELSDEDIKAFLILCKQGHETFKVLKEMGNPFI
jgi:hypothetical protein